MDDILKEKESDYNHVYSQVVENVELEKGVSMSKRVFLEENIHDLSDSGVYYAVLSVYLPIEGIDAQIRELSQKLSFFIDVKGEKVKISADMSDTGSKLKLINGNQYIYYRISDMLTDKQDGVRYVKDVKNNILVRISELYKNRSIDMLCNPISRNIVDYKVYAFAELKHLSTKDLVVHRYYFPCENEQARPPRGLVRGASDIAKHYKYKASYLQSDFNGMSYFVLEVADEVEKNIDKNTLEKEHSIKINADLETAQDLFEGFKDIDSKEYEDRQTGSILIGGKETDVIIDKKAEYNEAMNEWLITANIYIPDNIARALKLNNSVLDSLSQEHLLFFVDKDKIRLPSTGKNVRKIQLNVFDVDTLENAEKVFHDGFNALISHMNKIAQASKVEEK